MEPPIRNNSPNYLCSQHLCASVFVTKHRRFAEALRSAAKQLNTKMPASPPRVSVRATCGLPQALQPPPSDSSSSESDTDDLAPPPELVSASTAKLLESLGLMLRSRWGHERRHHPNLLLPIDLLDGTDLRWLIDPRGARRADDACGGRGTLETFAARCRESPTTSNPPAAQGGSFIHSPRSAVVLVRNGYSAASLLPVKDDPATTARRQRNVDKLAIEYAQFCRDVSSEFIANVLRGTEDVAAHIAPAAGGLATSHHNSTSITPRNNNNSKSGASSPRVGGSTTLPSLPGSPNMLTRASSASPTMMHLTSGTRQGSPSAKGGMLTGSPTPASRCRPQDLRRLQRHRAALTVDWGAKQQALANETFNVRRVQALLSQRRQDVQHRASSGGSFRSCSRDAARQPTNVHALDEHERGEDSGALDTDPTPATSASSPHKKHEQRAPAQNDHRHAAAAGSDDSPTASVRARVSRVREESRRLQEEKRKQTLEAIERKSHRAEEASARRVDERKAAQAAHHARSREARDVLEKMERVNDVKRMMVVRQLEISTAARANWETEQYRKQQDLRRRAKLRTTLQHHTREFVEKAHHSIEKATSQQEMVVGDDVEVQRKLKAESRTSLLRLLDEEEHIMRKWAKFERLEVSPGTQSSPGSPSTNTHFPACV
jgi:hypothetical protein